MATIKDSIKILNCGIKLTNLNSLNTLTNLANNMESRDSIGIKLIATITKSKTFQDDLKKSSNDFSAIILIIISVRKTKVIK